MQPDALHEATAPGSDYVFDNRDPNTDSRFEILTALYDPATTAELTRLGVKAGWRCLDAGAGSGSVAEWLSDCVGPTGQVVATDIEPRYLRRIVRPNLIVIRHDLAAGPLPAGHFDLVHARLVLMHLPRRTEVLGKLISALKPGGCFLIEEFDALSVLPDERLYRGETRLKASEVMRRVMTDRGVDLGYGRTLLEQLKRFEVQDLAAEGRLSMWQGGSEGSKLMRANFRQLESALIETGQISEADLERELVSLDDLDFVVPSPIMWSVRGRRSDASS